MDYQLIATIVISLTVLFGYLNERFIQKENSIIIVLITLGITGTLFVFDTMAPAVIMKDIIESMLDKLNFTDFVLQGVLSFLLFAGSLHIDFSMLKEKKWEIITLATFSTIISTFIIGYSSYYLLLSFNLEMPFIYCLIFGALISPTDPIAVLSMLKELKAPKDIQTTIAGESLFNDGVGIVLFLTLISILNEPTSQVELLPVMTMFFRQVFGGITVGITLGLLGYKMIKQSSNNVPLCIMITIWIVTAGYTLCEHLLHISAPIAMVVSGIFIGNKGNSINLPKHINNELNQFWYIIDELLNSFLFLLVGLECIVLGTKAFSYFSPMIAIIPLVLIARLVAVSAPMIIIKKFKKMSFNPHLIGIISWGGLRGGLSIALALSLPQSYERDIIFCMTYAIVIFSIVVQGMSIKHLFMASEKHLKIDDNRSS